MEQGNIFSFEIYPGRVNPLVSSDFFPGKISFLGRVNSLVSPGHSPARSKVNEHPASLWLESPRLVDLLD